MLEKGTRDLNIHTHVYMCNMQPYSNCTIALYPIYDVGVARLYSDENVIFITLLLISNNYLSPIILCAACVALIVLDSN